MDHFSGVDEAHPIRRMTATVVAAVKDVEDVDPVFMAAADRAAALAEIAEIRDRLHLVELSVVAASGDLAAEGGHRSVAAWRESVQRRDGVTARRDDRLAEALTQRWTATARAVRRGGVSMEQAARIVRGLDSLAAALDEEWAETLEGLTEADPEAGPTDSDDTPSQAEVTRDWIEHVLTRAETTLIELADHHTPRELDRIAEGILSRVAPEHAEELERRALERAERRARDATSLTMQRRGDVVRMTVDMPLAAAAMTRTYLESITAPRVTHPGAAAPPDPAGADAGDPGAADGAGAVGRQLVDPWLDPRTGRRVPHARRMGQAFVALMERVTTRHLPQHGGLGASVTVVIDLESLRDGVGHGVIGDPDGDGTRLSAGEVRRLACSSSILPVVLGSDSVPLDVGRTSRLFVNAQRRAHSVTHPVCEALECTIPAAWCESHHKRDPWARGGTTDLADLAFLCPWHHHVAHDSTYVTEWLAHGARFRRRR